MVLGTIEPWKGEQRRVEKLSMTKNIFIIPGEDLAMLVGDARLNCYDVAG